MKSIIFPPITREQIKTYATASGDHNPIHLSDEAAARAGLPSVIAHGMLIMGLAAEALTKWGIQSHQLHSFKSKFKGMTYPGDILMAEATKQEPGKLEWQLLNQKNEVVLTAEARYS